MNWNRYIAAKFSDVRLSQKNFRPEQPPAIKFLVDNPFSALFVDVGIGKSIITLSAIMRLVCRFEINHVLIIAPKRVALETWPTEIRSWKHTAPLSFVHVREDDVVKKVNVAGRLERKRLAMEFQEEIELWQAEGEDAQAMMKEFMTRDRTKALIKKARVKAAHTVVREHFKTNPAIVHIINREQVEFLVSAWGRDWPYDTVVVDESSCLRDHKSRRVKSLIRVRPFMKRMHQLTATPAAETYLHLFPQIYLLDLGQRFGRHVTKFRERYFTQNVYSMKWSLRPGAEEEISAKIADICLVMKAEDYLDLEEPLVVDRKVKLSKDQLRLYRAMERDLVIELPGEVEIEAETAAALSQKLTQMASGVIYQTVMDEVDGGLKRRRVVHHLHSHKLEALQELVESVQGENLLVIYWHNSTVDILQKAFPKSVVMDKKGQCLKAWNAKKIPMLLLQPGASFGLNVQLGGRRIVFYDIPWSLELYLQTIGRLAGARQLARPEGERLVIIHHLIAEGTIDEEIVDVLASKDCSQEMLFALITKIRKRIAKKKLLMAT